MLIRVRDRCAPRSWEITSHSAFLSRRRLVQAAGAAALLPLAGAGAFAKAQASQLAALEYKPAAPDMAANGGYTAEALTPYRDVTHYNNFYEFGTGKKDPARYAGNFRVEPWSVRITGEAEKPGKYALEDLLSPLQERIYRLRCVEAWSMVIPWVGFPLLDLLKRYPPNSRARYVAFTTLHDPRQMRGQRSRISFFSSLKWPYVEGLRMDEARHPLAFLAVGLYGKALPGQNGAPLRLVVPWKYGFKSIKSIVEIRYTRRQPPTTWNLSAPREYGFYSNVNPEVHHPRWSQAQERRLPGTLFGGSNIIPTRMFNGYGEQVAQLYTGMDLRRNY